MATRDKYASIDLRSPTGPAFKATAWPAKIPELTAPEAVRAAKRLWRFSMGTTFDGKVEVTSGNRRTYSRFVTGSSESRRYDGNVRVLFVNPEQGWRDFIHDLSHHFHHMANPLERPHSAFHAKFEARLVREVIRRGWLDGKLKDAPKAPVSKEDARKAKRAVMLARAEARMVAWERKRKRAETAIKKLKLEIALLKTLA